MNPPAEHGDTPDLTEQIAEGLTRHFVLWHWMNGPDEPPGEYRCSCGLKFGFSDSAIAHQADALTIHLSARSTATPDAAAQVAFGVVLDEDGSTDYYDTEAEAREWLAEWGGLHVVRIESHRLTPVQPVTDQKDDR